MQYEFLNNFIVTLLRVKDIVA